MSRRTLILLAVMLSVLLAAVLWLPSGSGRPRLDFALESADGPVKLEDFRGKAVLVYFGYTYCPDVCPTALVGHAAALRQLRPEELARVSAIFVSVDPERDRPDRLKTYASFFHPSIIGATASSDEMARIAHRWGVFYARQPADADGRYTVDHSSESFVLDGQGNLVARLPHASPPEMIAGELRRALRQ